MGIIELDHNSLQVIIYSDIFLYGNAIHEDIRKNIEEEINRMWNEPRALLWLDKRPFLVVFEVKVFLHSSCSAEEIVLNKNPRNNYIRIEPFAHGNISFVDGLGCNTGYFLVENLYQGSTTAAHEYGHTLGLPHPENIDIRGEGTPGIMYPRGTWVDAKYQYDPHIDAGQKGGTLYPIHRRVLQNDIDNLNLHSIIQLGGNVLGSFSAQYHEAHRKIS